MTDHEYTYRLTLDDDDSNVGTVCFRYAQAPAPHEDDTTLYLNQPSWEALGSPEELTMILRPAP